MVVASKKMKLFIKVLGRNEEFTIGLPDEPVKVEVLKLMLERNKGFPVSAQRILFKGKALLDSKTIEDYGITEGSKLHLSIKATEDIERLSKDTGNSSNSESSANGEGEFYKRLRNVLKKHFTDDDAEKIISTFSESYSGMINALSLDDIERIAKYEIDKNKVQ